MANEITVTTGLAVTKSNLVHNSVKKILYDTMTGTHIYNNTQDVGTTEEALALGADLGTPRWCIVRNLDVTNYVELGSVPVATFVPFIRLKAGAEAVFPLGTAAPYAKANTATVKLGYTIYED